MASVENEKDEPEPDLLDDPLTISPLCAAGALGLNANLDFGFEPGDRRGPYLFAGLSPSAPGWAAPTTSGINSYGPQREGQTDAGHIDQPPALTKRERRQKLMQEKGKQRSHGIRKQKRIENPTIRTHGIKKYISPATPLFMDTQVGQARVASTGYVGLGGRKQKVEKGEVHEKERKEDGKEMGKENGWVKGSMAVAHTGANGETNEAACDSENGADYRKADAMLRELLGENGYDLLKWNGL